MRAGSPDAVLEVEHLTVTLAGERVVDDVSFRLGRGEMVAVIGPNGSGKTTLFRALLGLLPHQGSVHWHAGETLGYVPQRFAVAPATPITVEEFFLLKLGRFWLPRSGYRKRLAVVLGGVGLDKRILAQALDTLSSGQAQRMLVGWATLDDPGVLLFDEPSAAVDVGFSESIYELMERRRAQHDTAVLFISHDLNVVSRHVSSVLCLNRRLLCHGAPAEVLTPDRLRQLFGDIAVYGHHHGTRHAP